MKLRHKLLLSSIVVASLVAATSIVGLMSSHDIGEVYDEISDQATPALLALGQIRAYVHLIHAEAVSCALLETRREKEHEKGELLEAKNQLQAWQNRFAEVAKDEEEQRLAEELRNRTGLLCAAALALANAGEQGRDGNDIPASKEAMEEEEHLFDAMIDKAIAAQRQKLMSGDAAADALTARMIAVCMATSVFAIICTGAVGFLVHKAISTPIAELAKATVQVAEGNLDYRVGTSRKDEIGQLGRAFDQMSTDLSKTLVSKRTLEQANEQLAAEIDQRKQAEDALKVANRELTDFVYVASHDLREPLRKISAFGGLLADSLKASLQADDRENLEYMIDGANRMTQMIEGLLLYSRLNTKDEPSETVDLNEIVERLERFELATMLEETGTSIHLPQPLPKVKGDPAQLGQLLQNLIANGIKYRRDEVAPQITVSATALDDQTVRIEVRDNGIGIAQEYYQDVFKMFNRLHSRRNYQGTGIGLAVCKRIVDRHRGGIGVESTEGEGSTFWFTLSIAEQAPVTTEPAAVS